MFRSYSQSLSETLNTNKTDIKLLINKLKPLGIMINILGTPCYNIKLVYVLIKQLIFKIVLKHVKHGVFCVVECSLYHPVIKIHIYHTCKYNYIIHK
jgi:hypothetical protein